MIKCIIDTLIGPGYSPGIACVLVGARDEKQVADNSEAMNLKLNEDELELITSAADKFNLADA